MDFMNKRSKIYSIGGIVLGVGAIIPNSIVLLGNNREIAQTYMLLNIGQLFLGLLFILLGTQTLFANRKRAGYIYYIVAALNFTMIVTRILS